MNSFNQRQFDELKIRRVRKYELDQAIEDLIKRGFELVNTYEEVKESYYGKKIVYWAKLKHA